MFAQALHERVRWGYKLRKNPSASDVGKRGNRCFEFSYVYICRLGQVGRPGACVTQRGPSPGLREIEAAD